MNLLLAVLCIFSIVACTPKEKSVEDPYFESTSTRMMDLRKVEMNDSVTVVSVDTYQQPKFWISFTSKMHLLADGKKYAIKKVEGAELDQYFWMPESGTASFKVFFEPLPMCTESFDFIEGDGANSWNVYGIDLTGKKKFESAKGIPADAIKATTQYPDQLPAPEFNIGETTLKIHLLNNRKGHQPKVNVFVNTILGAQDHLTASKYQKENETELKFWQYGLAKALFLVDDIFMGNIYLKAGETADLYLDMNATVYNVLKQREMKKGVKCPIEFPKVYSNGAYAWTSGWDVPEMSKYVMKVLNPNFADYKLTADEYTDKVIQQYHALSDSISESGLSSFEKELLTASLKQTVVVAAAYGDGFRFNNAYYANRGKMPKVNIDKMTEKHYAKVAALFDVTEPTLIWGPNYSQYVTSFIQAEFSMTYWPKSAGTEKTVFGILGKNNKYVSKIERGDILTEQDLKEIKAIENDFVREMLLKMDEQNRAVLKAVEGKAVIEETPKVAPKKLFEAIIAPYKGKVVLVDFWNTWCGPCRMALEAIEPMKKGELKSDDLVWLYIANETSPLTKYKTMIPGIEGKHYRLNKDQWKVITDQLKINGIPSYVLVDRDGKYALRNDLRDHEQLKKTLKKMIE